MKNIRINSIFAILALTLLFSGCAKDKNEPSKATFWPNLTVTGDKLVIINEGDVYDDAGAVATVNGVPVDVTVSSNVDESTAGVYEVAYSALNDDGIAAKDGRTVIVLPSGTLFDASSYLLGNYTLSAPVRPAPVPSMSISEVAPGLYYLTNMYGSNGSNQVIEVPAYIYSTDGITFTVLDGSNVSAFGGYVASGGTAVWNGVTSKLACSFNIAAVGPGSLFSRTWAHN